MNAHMSNVDKLVHAGVVEAKDLSAEHQVIINTTLSDREIQELISIRNKLVSQPGAQGKTWACSA